MAIISGTVSVFINGARQWASGTWKYSLGAPKRTARLTADGALVGFDVEPRPATLSGTIIDSSDFDVREMTELQDATLQLTTANGKTVVFTGAFYSGSDEITANSAEMEVEFTAATAEEIK